MMDDQQLLRYSRQIMLPQLDIAGQEQLLSGTVLIIGLGGLGCPAAMYLAAAGVGQLVLADDDVVELSNLQRQIAHRTDSIGKSKVASAAAAIEALNPDTEIRILATRLLGQDLEAEVAAADIVLDCSDSLRTRLAVNKACHLHRKPLVSGAAIRMEAQLAVFDLRLPDSPCYQCLYSEDSELSLSCSESGVLAPLVGIIGAMQALEALKLLAEIGEKSSGRLLAFDGQSLQWREMKLLRDADCPVCGAVS